MTLILRNLKLPLQRITLDVNAELSGRITGIFGPSGSGKTSLLEAVAGIRKPATAYIEAEGHVLTDTSRRLHVPVEHRAVGYVPQDLALFPHLSVKQNLLFGFRKHEQRGDFINLTHIVEVLEIETLMNRGISLLSGGEKQRVAFARAILASPRILLMDEPLASLDRNLKEKMIEYLLRLRDAFHIPMLYVSHDADEVAALCDEVVILEEGCILKRGVPQSLFEPDTRTHYISN